MFAIPPIVQMVFPGLTCYWCTDHGKQSGMSGTRPIPHGMPSIWLVQDHSIPI